MVEVEKFEGALSLTMLGIKKKYYVKQELDDDKPSIHGRMKRNNNNNQNHQTGFCLMSMLELQKPIIDTPCQPVKKAAASTIIAVFLITVLMVSVGWLDIVSLAQPLIIYMYMYTYVYSCFFSM